MEETGTWFPDLQQNFAVIAGCYRWLLSLAVIAGCYSLLFRGMNGQESRISAAKSGIWPFFSWIYQRDREAYGPLGSRIRRRAWPKLFLMPWWVFRSHSWSGSTALSMPVPSPTF